MAIDIRNASKRFGANSAGKTTLLRVVVGLLRPTGGAVAGLAYIAALTQVTRRDLV